MLGAVPSWEISVTVLLVLAAVLGMSCATYATLVRRATSHRQWVALSEWGRDAGFRFIKCDPERLPPPLDQLTARRPAVRICLGGPRGMLIEVQAAAPDPEWHLMVRQIPNVWRPTGLRPAHQPHSFLDLYSLSSYPLLSDGERFLVFGTDSIEARRLAESMIRSLLPPDVGLLLHGRTMVLDFSGRPFDPLEFARMIALADQLAQRLPMPTA